MQENLKQVKRSKTFNIISICLLLVLFIASVTLAVISPVFTCSVASAADTNTVTSLEQQASSDYTFENFLSYPALYGVFINKNYTITYADCKAHDSYFSTLNDEQQITFRVKNQASSDFYSRRFEFQPMKYTNQILADSGAPFTLTDTIYLLKCNSYQNDEQTYSESAVWIYNDIADYNNMINWELADYLGFKAPFVALFDFESIPKTEGQTYAEFFVPSTLGVSIEMFTFWSDFIYLSLSTFGSAVGGDIGDLQNQIESLQNQLNQANQEKQELQDRIDSLNYNFLTTLSRENLYYYNQSSSDKNGTGSYTFLPNAYDTTLSEAERNFSCPIYGYSSQTANRPYLFGLQLPYEVPAGSTLRLSYTAFCVGAVFSGVPFSELWRLGYTYAFYCGQYGYPTTDNIGQLTVVDSYNNANGNIFIKVNQPTNFIAFDVVSRSNYSNKLVGYLTTTEEGVFSLVTSASSGASWYFAFNTLSVYYQGDILSSAVDSARKDGYNTGYQEGKVAGYNKGYSEGVSDQGDYSFMGLLGAVFDAPIQAFKGLLNFEILGVNMTAFVSSLFALAIIVVIIKISLGGK